MWARFYVRLAALFLALLLALGAAFAALSARAALRLSEAADQRLNYTLAAELAARFQPYLEASIEEDALTEMIGGLTQVNRRIDLYLLGSEGMIKWWYMPGGRAPAVPAVDTAPLDRFLAGDAALPLVGDDPARPEARRPFSVAPLRIMGESGCYLYIVLQGPEFDEARSGLVPGAFRRALAPGIALALLATALVGLALFALLTRRLAALAGAADALAAGDLDARAPEAGGDELAHLGRGFNRMAGTIKQQMADLQQTDRLRRELVANVSHDLRSPLTAVQGYLETLQLKGDALAPDERQRYVATALAAARRLTTRVAELFDLSKLDADGVVPQMEAFPLAELVQDVLAAFEPEAERRGLALRAVFPDAPPLVRADLGLVERVLMNLLDNALRFTPPGGHVELRLSLDPGAGRVRVAVSDTGPGIAPDDLPHVFERFYRAADGRTGDGAGLGLAIARRVVELHGGTLAVESRPGEGATFTFSLPAA